MSCSIEPADAGLKTRSCLIVDDSRVVRRVARRILEAMDFVVDEAFDGQLALDACRLGMPTAILLDWEMPVMNGIDFLRSLRLLDGGKAPVVIFCTSLGDTRHIQEALDAGASEYVIKPFDADVLREKFAKVMPVP